MGSDAVSSWGAKLKLESHVDSSGSDYVELGEILSINGPNMTKGAIECTHLNSSNRAQEFINGIRSGGAVTFSMNFIYAEYLKLKNEYDNNDYLAGFQILMPDSRGTIVTFDAIVTALGTNIPFNDRITVDCTLTISGSVALA